MITLRLVVSIYAAILVVWMATRLSVSDRWWWLFLLNVATPYLFLPAPVILLITFFFRRVDLLLIGGGALGLGLYLYGGLFLPHLRAARAAPNTSHLVVMTYNILGNKADSSALIAALRASDADIIALQELNAPLAAAIAQQLGHDYPYQVLEPVDKNNGMGVISRYRLEQIHAELPGDWLGKPQILRVDLDGNAITFVNIHCTSINTSWFAWQQTLERAAYKRETQAQSLADFAVQHDAPLILVGDFNTTDQTAAYRILSSQIHDTWREAGFGLGHTFPGPHAPLGAMVAHSYWPMTLWLVRIDYIYHSDQWVALSAHTGPEIGKSDHRPVVAELALITTATPSVK